MQTQQTYPQNIQTPLVSFIITTYNLPLDYLKECLNSIIKLSLNAREREIILLDDGSDISPLNDLIEYQNQIIYLRQPNQGVSVARNYGMMIAKGKYIQFVDGDDYLVQAAYEHCLDIVRYHQPDIVTFHFAKDKTEETSYELPTPISGTEYLNSYNLHGAVWSYIFRHQISGSLQFTPGIVYGEDEEFTPQLFLRAERIFKMDSEAYYYRENPHSVLRLNANKFTPSAGYTEILNGYHYRYFMTKKANLAWVDLPSGDYESAQKAKLVAVSNDANAQLVYTTDGTEPTASSKKVDNGTEIEIPFGETTLKVGLLINGVVSSVLTRTYKITEPAAFEPYDITVYVNADKVNWIGSVNFWAWCEKPSENLTTKGAWP